MLPSSNNSGSFSLRPKARIIHTLGDELISSETVAVIELVKNSYDADATYVFIRFNPPLDSFGAGSVEVADNGIGMDMVTVTHSWMEPATSNKKRVGQTRRGRTVLGEKGIGRFAASRLARSLEVVTRAAGQTNEIRILFDWDQFSDDKYLDEVLILWEDVAPQEIAPNGRIGQLIKNVGEVVSDELLEHGTILNMSGLCDTWDRSKLEDLRTGLQRLVSPFTDLQSVRNTNGFRIFLDVPSEYQDLNGIVEAPEALNNPHYLLRGSVDSAGHYEFQIRVMESEATQITGKFGIDDRRTGVRDPVCGPIELEFRVWDRDSSAMAALAAAYHSTREVVSEDLDAAAGINIYRDGFRVFPYGEPRNDWLRLDIRRVNNPTLRLSNNQITGYVLITKQGNPLLLDQSNREGIIDGPPLRDLCALVTNSLSLLERRRYDYRHHPSEPRSSKQTSRGGVFAGFDLHAIETLAARKHINDAELIGLIKGMGKDLERRISEVQEVLSRYSRLATLGQLVDTVLHDGRTPLTKIGNLAQLCLNELESNPCGDATDVTLRNNLEGIVTQSHAVASVFRKIAPFGGRKRGKPREIRLESVITQAFSVLDTDIKERGVHVSLPATTTQVTADSVEIQQVIINLLENSLYWLNRVDRNSRRIEIVVTRLATGEVEILFADSGPGVPSELRERIFDPYFSGKDDGIGLGLAISGEIVTDYYGGTLELADDGPLPGATFRIKLSRRV